MAGLTNAPSAVLGYQGDEVMSINKELIKDLREAQEQVANLQAALNIVDMAREILVEAEDYEKRTGKTISWLNKLRDAIKEVE